MKKTLLIIALVLLLAGGMAFSQTLPDFSLDTMGTVFNSFADGVANALPMASTVGLQWSDAYIGNFPHLGVGVSVGFASMPLSSMSTALDTLGLTDTVAQIESYIPSQIQSMIGFPFPAAAIDARLGGFVAPFDIGFKIGFIPDQAYNALSNATGGLINSNNLDYFLVGGDVRYALVKEKKGFSLIPDITIGGGYTYYRGKIAIPIDGVSINQDIQIPTADSIGSGTLQYNNYNISSDTPTVGFNWESHVIDVKAQISKKILLLFTPYIGVGASYGRSNAGGGLYSGLNVTKNGNTSSLDQLKSDITAAQDAINNIKDGLPPELQAYYDQNIDLSQINIPDSNSLLVQKWVNGFGFRAFGGLSINLWFLKIDTSVMYDIVANSLGGQIGVRLQF